MSPNLWVEMPGGWPYGPRCGKLTRSPNGVPGAAVSLTGATRLSGDTAPGGGPSSAGDSSDDVDGVGDGDGDGCSERGSVLPTGASLLPREPGTGPVIF